MDRQLIFAGALAAGFVMVLMIGPFGASSSQPTKSFDPTATPGMKAAASDVPTGPRKSHLPPHAGEIRSLSIKELGNFDYDPDKGGTIPADVLALDGMAIRLRGFMIPMSQTDRITRFALVPSLFSCCYGRPPTIQHTVDVELIDGKSLDYSAEPMEVEGVLQVGEVKENGYVNSLFHIACKMAELKR